MPRSMEIETPLGERRAAVSPHARARGVEPLERVRPGAAQRSAARSSTSTTSWARTSRCRVTLQDDSTAAFQRIRDAVLGGRSPRALSALHRHGVAVGVVSDAHERLSHLPGEDGPRDSRRGVRRSSDGGLQVRADRDRTRSGTTACSIARPTSTSSAGCWSTRASTTTTGTSTAATRWC